MIGRMVGTVIIILVGSALLPEASPQIIKSSSYYYTGKNKPHKQTYLEYVQERLKVEKMLK